MGDLESDLAYSILKDSACEGKPETIKNLLDKGFNVNHEYPDGSSLLHYACRNQQKQCIQLLLENGADFDKCDKEGNTALHIGIYQCDKEIWKNVLIFSPYNNKLKKDMTLLHINQFFDMYKNIIENKADVINKLSELQDNDLKLILNTRNKEGNSLLLIAFSNNQEIAYQIMSLVTTREISFELDHLEKIKTSLSDMVGGFDYIGFHIDENKYFSIIQDNDNLNILTSFLTAIERNLQKRYANLLMKACTRNSFQNVNELITRARGNLNKNVCIKGIPDDITSALTEETELPDGDIQKVKSILVQFASKAVFRKFVINCRTANDSTPLTFANNNDNIDIIKVLLRNGASLFVTDKDTESNENAESNDDTESNDDMNGYLFDMYEYFNSNGEIYNNLSLETDKLELTNAIGDDNKPIWFRYIGKPNNNVKATFLDLIEIDEEIALQKFIF